MVSNIPFFYKCKSCANQGTTNQGTPACAKFKIAINPEEDFCAWHENQNAMGCLFCGSTENVVLEEIDGKYYSFCANHHTAFHSCQGCTYNNVCGFKSDHSEPQMVTKTIRQGGMIMQTQGKNPKLVQKHCQTCRCSMVLPEGGDPFCLKEDAEAACLNWQPQITLLQQYSQ